MAGEELKPDYVALFIRRLPRSLRDRFKAHCSERGMTLKRKIVELMQFTVDGYELRKVKDVGIQGPSS